MTFSLASLMTRYKPIDVNEFQTLANAYLQQQQAASVTTGTPQAGTSVADPFVNSDGTSAYTSTTTADAEAAAAAAAQSQAAAAAQSQAAADAQASAAQAQAQAQAATAPATDAVRGVQTAAQATTTTAATQTAVAIPSSSIAPRKANDFWTDHIAQFQGQYLKDGPSMRPNCGPASVTMALRMIGLDIPGFNGQRSETVLDKARVIATGKNDISVGTTDAELEKLISASGGKWSESQNMSQITSWVKQGIPVVLSGNPSKGWDSRYNANQVYPFDGGHWVTVSGYDKKTGYYVVNDPLSQIGPLYVSESELASYTQAHGQLGIAVFR